MTAPPVSQSGLCMDPAHYRALLKWHLGVPLIRGEFGGLPCAACRRPVDVFGDHAVVCKRSGLWNRHLGVQTFLCQMLTEARVPHEREVAITPGSQDRPADILLHRWHNGRDLAVDLTVVHSMPAGGGREPGAAGRVFAGVEARKNRRYAAACEAQRIDFKPLVLDTFGGIHGVGRDVWAALAGRCVAGCAHQQRSAELGRARQRLSVRLMESVAQQLCALAYVTVPGDRDDEEGDAGLPRGAEDRALDDDDEDVEAP